MMKFYVTGLMNHKYY